MEENGVWRTVGGRRIFIKDGQDLASAMKESGKFSKKENKNSETKAKEYKTLEEQIEYVKQDEEKLLKAIDESSNSEEAGKRICEVLQERQGFNEKPKLLDEKDFNDLSDDKYIKLYRGISDGEKTADEYIEQFKNGKNEYGKGLNAYGVGHYTSEDKNVAENYGKTIEMALPKEAKIGVINMNDYDINDINELSAKNFRPYINDMEKYYNKYGDDITRIIDELERELLVKTHHGMTRFTGEGSHTHEDRVMLYTVVSAAEVNDVYEIIKSIDKQAFVNIVKTNAVKGKFYQEPID